MINGIRRFEIRGKQGGDTFVPEIAPGFVTVDSLVRIGRGHPLARASQTTNQVGITAVNGAGEVTSAGVLGFAFGESEAMSTAYYGTGFAIRPREARPSSSAIGAFAEEIPMFAASDECFYYAALHSEELTAINASTPPISASALRAKLFALVGTTYGLKRDVSTGSVMSLSTAAATIKYFECVGYDDASLFEARYTAAGVNVSDDIILKLRIRSATSQYLTPSVAGTTQTNATQGTTPSGGFGGIATVVS